jgi:hypothetical protein
MDWSSRAAALEIVTATLPCNILSESAAAPAV